MNLSLNLWLAPEACGKARRLAKFRDRLIRGEGYPIGSGRVESGGKEDEINIEGALGQFLQSVKGALKIREGNGHGRALADGAGNVDGALKVTFDNIMYQG